MTQGPQSPYLQVALPLIEDVKGGEALSGLWRVFTKCQQSIQDGSRLENISWRLWYKSLHPSSPSCGGGGPESPLHLQPFPSSRRSSASLAGSSFTESVASTSFGSSHLSESFHPTNVEDDDVGRHPSSSTTAAGQHGEPSTSSNHRPTETHSEPLTPSLREPPPGHHHLPSSTSRPALGRASTATPQYASTGDLSLIDTSASMTASSTPRPVLTVRAKSTPRLKSTSPYEVPEPKSMRVVKPFELDEGGISFGRVLGQVYKEGTVPAMVRRKDGASSSSRSEGGRMRGSTGSIYESEDGHVHREEVVGPRIRVIDPTPSNTTPSTPAPSPHMTLWGSDLHPLSSGPSGSHEKTPRPRLQTVEDLSSASSSSLHPSLSSESSATLGSTSSPSHSRDSIRPIPLSPSAGNSVNEGKKLFFISPDNGDCSGSSVESERTSSGASVLGLGTGVGGSGQPQTVGSPESLEDGGLQMKRKGKGRASVSRTAQQEARDVPPRHISPTRVNNSPSYAPLASSPLKQTTIPQPAKLAEVPSPPAEEVEASRPKPPVRQMSVSSATSNTSRKPTSTKPQSRSKTAPGAARRGGPGHKPSRSTSGMIMTKASSTKRNGPMAPPTTTTAPVAPPAPVPSSSTTSTLPPSVPLTTKRRSSSSSTTAAAGRFAQEKAKAASAINASLQDKQLGGVSSSSSTVRPSMSGRRTSSSALTMTSTMATAAVSDHETEDDEDDEEEGSGDGDWASDSDSVDSPGALKGGLTIGRRSTRGRPTKYTAAAMEKARQEALVKFAEEEAERQKSLFRKVPVSKSAADLYGLGRELAASPAPLRPDTAEPGLQRGLGGGRSSGLLSDMFKGEREKREGSLLSSQKSSASLAQSIHPSSSQDLWQHGRDVGSSSSKTATPLARNKSAAALPQASGFTVGRGDDMETESEAETHGSADKIVLGTSEAQRRLALLASKKPPTPSAPRHHGLSGLMAMTPVGSNDRHQQHIHYPPTTRPLPPKPDSPTEEAPPVLVSEDHLNPVDMPPLPPPAAAPQSPRTTRRHMLAAELPEDLRKQLLWERMTRQRSYGAPINRSSSTPRLAAEADRPSVQRSAATESAPVSRAPSESASPPPPVSSKRNSGVLGPNILRPLTATGAPASPPSTSTRDGHRTSFEPTSPGTNNPYLEKVKASRKLANGPLSAYRSNPSSTNLARMGAAGAALPPQESSSDSDDGEDALTLLKRRNTHHGELNRLNDNGWDADYRSHGF